jgi:multisubunit Na+/H+ antiporter MnhG subunit
VGYFDALTSGYFKTAEDGRKLFFPWGVLGRGYVISSQSDYERLHRQVKVYTVVSLGLIIGAVALQSYIGAVVIGALLVAFYLVWVRFLLRGLQPSEDRLSLQESMTTQAVTHNATVLWSMEIGSLVFVAIGVFMLVVEPDNWLIALACIFFFALCAASFARMLVLRSRQASRLEPHL